MPNISIPAGTCLYGVNLSLWPARWLTWNWTEIKAEIDLAIAMKANCIRVFGDLANRIEGTMSLGTYTARWAQFLDYCGENGIYVPVCGGFMWWTGTVGSHNTSNPTDQQIADQIAETVDITEGYTNVPYFDFLNEFQLGRHPGAIEYDATHAALINTTVRSATSKACAFSKIFNDESDFEDDSWGGFEYSDFIGVHWYDIGAVANDGPATIPTNIDYLQTCAAMHPGKQICVEEFGACSTCTNRMPYIRQINNNFRGSRATFPVMLQWAIKDYPDQPDSGGYVYGLHDEDNQPHVELVNEWQRNRRHSMSFGGAI